MNKEKKTVS